MSLAYGREDLIKAAGRPAALSDANGPINRDDPETDAF
jgi:hypothetical protein